MKSVNTMMKGKLQEEKPTGVDPLAVSRKQQEIQDKIKRFRKAKSIPDQLDVTYDEEKDRFKVAMKYTKTDKGLVPENDNAKANEEFLRKNNLG